MLELPHLHSFILELSHLISFTLKYHIYIHSNWNYYIYISEGKYTWSSHPILLHSHFFMFNPLVDSKVVPYSWNPVVYYIQFSSMHWQCSQVQLSLQNNTLHFQMHVFPFTSVRYLILLFCGLVCTPPLLDASDWYYFSLPMFPPCCPLPWHIKTD